MLTKIKGIVISKINYSDNSVIAKIYTNAYGMQSYIVNSIKGNKGIVKQSHLLTLNLLDMEVYHQQNKNIQRIKDVRCNPVLSNIHNNITKSSIAIFISEVLYKSLKHENISDENLFNFFQQTILHLENTNQILSSFHLWFMLHYCSFLGFKPKYGYNAQNKYFSLADGCFVSQTNLYTCNEMISSFINDIIITELEDFDKIKISEDNRNKIYEALLKYYELHEISLGNINSYNVLKQVFE